LLRARREKPSAAADYTKIRTRGRTFRSRHAERQLLGSHVRI
jgi:hypothetical protein